MTGLEGKHWTVKLTVLMFPPSSACLCKLCIINVCDYRIWSFNITVLNILRHFKCFYNVLSHCLWLKYCRGGFNMDCKGPKLAFCSEIPLFYYFEKWSKYLRQENRWKIDTLVQQFYGYFALQVFEPVTWLKTINWCQMFLANVEAIENPYQHWSDTNVQTVIWLF